MAHPSFYTIPPGCSFATDLAKGVLAASRSPQELANTQIYLPTRRAMRALSAAFLQQSKGQALLLPKLYAIGDIEEDGDKAYLRSLDDASLPPAIPEMRRLCLMARQVQAFPISGMRPSEAQAFALARALIGLFDQVQNAEFDIAEMQDLWPKDLASHWQDIQQFLSILWQFWPRILAEEGLMDPVARRIALMKRQIELWQAMPPEAPVILAGSTGTLPATQKMMKAVSELPKGQIVFPGMMPDMSQDDWQAIYQDKVHPLHPLSVTCRALKIEASDIAIWPASVAQAEQSRTRQAFLAEVMRPASQTDRWRSQTDMPKSLQDAQSYQGFRRLDVQDTHEEAVVISLLMRQALETPEKTTILVTADRQLARMVRSELRRFDIDIDDSAGIPLPQTAIGGYLHLLARLFDSQDIFADLLALSAHPLSCGQTNRLTFRDMMAQLNRSKLRGPLGLKDLPALHEALDEGTPLKEFVKRHLLEPLAPMLAPMLGRGPSSDMSLKQAAQLLGQTAEAFAARSADALEEAVLSLWSGTEGEAAAQLLQDLSNYGDDFIVTGPAFAEIWQDISQATEVRLPYQRQSRLAILGAVESRMISADLVILSGLNEGTWPPKANRNLWMNQAMAERIGLPHKQWRIALSAHDFMMAAAMPEVVLTRARRQNDRITLPSRWLTRMDAVMTALSIEDLIAPKLPDDIAEILAWRRQVVPVPMTPPEPRPPVAMRPDRLSATQFDMLITNPYGIYAREVLGLRALAPVNERPNAALKGTMFHKALQDFTMKYPQGAVGEAHLEALLAIAKPHFDKWHSYYEVTYFWWPQFIAVAKWFLQEDNRLRQSGDLSFAEIKGALVISLGARNFTLVAKADRVVRHEGGAVTIIDYKTGTLPAKSHVAKGRATQMLVETALLGAGGYEAVGPVSEIRELEYWKLSGRGQEGGHCVKVTPPDLAAGEVLDVITALLTRFEAQDMAYYAEPDPRARQPFNDYRHLSRIKEWRVQEVIYDK